MLLVTSALLLPRSGGAPPTLQPPVDPLPAWTGAGVQPEDITDQVEDGRRVWSARIRAPATMSEVTVLLDRAATALAQTIGADGTAVERQSDPFALGMPAVVYRQDGTSGRASLRYQPGAEGHATIAVVFTSLTGP